MNLITDLTVAGIIDEQDAIKLEADLKNNNAPLGTLYFLGASKVLTHQPLHNWYFFIKNPYADYQPGDIKGDTTTYFNLLDILFRHSVITEVVYQKLKKFPLPDNKNTYLATLYLACMLSSFYQNFTIAKQLDFMKLLCGKSKLGIDGIINYPEKAKLTKDIKKGKMETYLDFFKYSFCCKVINLSIYQGKPKQLLKKLTKVLNTLLYYGAFSILDISYHEEDYFGEPIYDNKQSTLTIDTGARKYEYVYTFSVGKAHAYIIIWLVLEHLLQFINQLLADYTCSYRFTSVATIPNKTLFPSSEEAAICRIEQSDKYIFEYNVMEEKYLIMKPVNLSYRSPLSYTHIEYAIYALKECGLLSHLSEEQLNDAISKTYNKTYKEIGDLLTVFPGTIAVVGQNIAPGQKPYFDFLQLLAKYYFT